MSDILFPSRPEVFRLGVVLELCVFLIPEDVTGQRGGSSYISSPYLELKIVH